MNVYQLVGGDGPPVWYETDGVIPGLKYIY